jgi:hypothetical protein
MPARLFGIRHHDLWKKRVEVWEEYRGKKDAASKNAIATRENQITARIVEVERFYDTCLLMATCKGLENTFKPELCTEDTDVDSLYLDRSPHYSRFFDRQMFSCYTPHGIREIDGWFIAEIQSYNRHTHENPKDPRPARRSRYGFTADKLSLAIRRNPHLHNIIKTNLLENLRGITGCTPW